MSSGEWPFGHSQRTLHHLNGGMNEDLLDEGLWELTGPGGEATFTPSVATSVCLPLSLVCTHYSLSVCLYKAIFSFSRLSLSILDSLSSHALFHILSHVPVCVFVCVHASGLGQFLWMSISLAF